MDFEEYTDETLSWLLDLLDEAYRVRDFASMSWIMSVAEHTYSPHISQALFDLDPQLLDNLAEMFNEDE